MRNDALQTLKRKRCAAVVSTSPHASRAASAESDGDDSSEDLPPKLVSQSSWPREKKRRNLASHLESRNRLKAQELALRQEELRLQRERFALERDERLAIIQWIKESKK